MNRIDETRIGIALVIERVFGADTAHRFLHTDERGEITSTTVMIGLLVAGAIVVIGLIVAALKTKGGTVATEITGN
jgi:hypothetical protein